MSKYSFIPSEVNYNYYSVLSVYLSRPSITHLTLSSFFSSPRLSHLSFSLSRTWFPNSRIYLTLFLISLTIYFLLSCFLPPLPFSFFFFPFCFPLSILTFIYFVLYLFHSFFLRILQPFPPVMQFLTLIHLIPAEFAKPSILK
jgi:hypothetical protein